MRRRWIILGAAAALSVLVALGITEPALAQGAAPSDPGARAGDFLRETFAPIVGTIGGVVGVVALVKRDFALAFALIGLTILIAGFFLESSPYTTWGDDIVQTILGSGGEPEPPRGGRPTP